MAGYPLTFEEFKQGLTQGFIPGLKCLECGENITPPSAVCPACSSPRLERCNFNAMGTVRTFTVVRVGPEGFHTPYIVALVELDDGPWIAGNIEGIDPDDAGMDLMGTKVAISSRSVPKESSEPGVEGVVLTFRPIRTRAPSH